MLLYYGAKPIEKGLKAFFNNNEAKVIDTDGGTLLVAKRKNELFFLLFFLNKTAGVFAMNAKQPEMMKWHNGLGPLS